VGFSLKQKTVCFDFVWLFRRNHNSHETYSDGWSDFYKAVKNFFVVPPLYGFSVSMAHTNKSIHLLEYSDEPSEFLKSTEICHISVQKELSGLHIAVSEKL
jgi:hypothetical protein